MPNGSASFSTALKSRLAGTLLVAIGAIFLYLFVEHPSGELPGFAHAWRGGPLLLGTSFFTINGFFLIFQKRFSLGGFLIAGILSAALTSATHAYVRSIRETTTEDVNIPLPADKLTQFIARSRELVTPDRLRQVAEDLATTGRFRQGVDFDSAYLTFGTVKGDKNQVTVTVNFESCPFVHPYPGYLRSVVTYYSTFVHGWLAQSLTNPESTAHVAAVLINPAKYDPDDAHCLVQLTNSFVDYRNMRFGNSPGYMVAWAKGRREGVAWLRDHETDAELKGFLSGVVTEMDKWIQQNGH